jgi:hypothetical protein
MSKLTIWFLQTLPTQLITPCCGSRLSGFTSL